MHYILLKGSDDQSRVAVSQELKRLRKRVKELKQQLEIFKLSNDALQQDNLDLSYDKADLAYEYAQEMAENWKKGYEEEIAELKNQQNEKAIQQLKKLKAELVNKVSPVCLSYTDYVQQVYAKIDNKIKQLKGEDNENI